jgi:hypothetical protein
MVKLALNRAIYIGFKDKNNSIFFNICTGGSYLLDEVFFQGIFLRDLSISGGQECCFHLKEIYPLQ